VRPLPKTLTVFWGALVSLGPLASAHPATEPVPTELRQLAVRAAQRGVWPRLRRYAESRKQSEQRGLALFVLGYREYEAEDYSAAASDLREAALSGFSLADCAEYYWAAAARQANDPGQAGGALEGFSSRFPESAWRLEALEVLASALIEAQEPMKALQALLGEPRVRQRPSLALLVAQAYFAVEQFPEAARAFQEVYFAFPTAPQAKAAAEALEQIRSKLGADFPVPTEEIQTARVESFFKAARYEEALKEYEGLLDARPTSPFVLRWQLGRARCLLRLRRNGKVLAGLSASFAAAPAMDAERLALLVEANAREGDANAMLQPLAQIQSLYPQSPAHASALFFAGNLFFQQGDWQNAARYYQPLTESSPQSEHARDASWRLAWSYYLGQDSAKARQAFVDHSTRYPDSPRVPAALYWLGRVEEARGAASEARALYGLLGKRFVHSYYAVQAGQRLRNLPSDRATAGESQDPIPGSTAAALVQSLPSPELPGVPLCASAPPSKLLRPALTFRALSLEDLAERYLKAVLSERPASPDVRFFLSQLEAEQGNVSAALFDAIKIVPDYSEVEFTALSREVWDLLFPRSYWKLVERQARANRLDPYLVMGLIRQESAFNPRATSVADARGLMQILPRTASRSRRPARVRSVARRLYDPAYNVRFGCAHLRSLRKQFGGSLEHALAAYNAGDFRVKEWISRYSFREAAEFLETIPIPATRAYVEAVLRDAAIYRQLMTGRPKFAGCPPATTPATRAKRPAGKS